MENSNNNIFPLQKSQEEWEKQMSPEQYHVMRKGGTEKPFSGKYNMHFIKGIYTCAGCKEKLFTSEAKFDGHCGWPSFDQAIEAGKIIERTDNSHAMIRTEILCAKCGGHLGHVFDDGPSKTRLRYCVNSVSLDFEKNNS